MKKNSNNNLIFKFKNIVIFVFLLIIIILTIISISFTNKYKLEKAKQHAIIFGDMAVSKYLKEHGNDTFITAMSYNLDDVDISNKIDICPINGKKYNNSKNSFGYSNSRAVISYNEYEYIVQVQLDCEKYLITYYFMNDFVSNNKVKFSVEKK